MTTTLALLQSANMPDTTVFIYLGVIALATLIALGLKFWINLFEIITAPAASIKHHGQQDNFFFSLLVAFFGGLIGTGILMYKQSALMDAFNSFASTLGTSIGAGNGNPVYRDEAIRMAIDRCNSMFNGYFMDNLIWFGIIMVMLWLIIGMFAYLGARMFGGQAGFGDYLGSLAYGSFFMSIGLGMCGNLIINAVDIVMNQAAFEMDILGIVGAVLMLYGIILYLIAAAQAADLTAAQLIGVLIILAIVLGGAGFGIYKGVTPIYEAFNSDITGFDPSRNSI